MTSPTTPPRWATKHQAAQHLGVSIYTLERWVKDRRLTAYRAGPRLVRFDLNELDAMLTPTTSTEAAQ
ncbi:helix-turn-helix DNA binding protein [Mycobacterium phage Mask]|nr:helix-turn-helix DNA binding protein [Mycobacterium phage Mask]